MVSSASSAIDAVARDLRAACRAFQDAEPVLARSGALAHPAARAVMEEWASRSQGIILAVLTWAAREARVLEQEIATAEGKITWLRVAASPQAAQGRSVAACSTHNYINAFPSWSAPLSQQSPRASHLAQINLAQAEPTSHPNMVLLLVF